MSAQPRERDGAVSNVDAVTYVLAELGGVDTSVHLERIAVRVFELIPGAFRWDLDEYSAFVDKDKVRVSLTDAEKPEKGGLVEAVGVTRSGHSKRTDLWRLTSKGAAWVRENEDRIRETLGTTTPRLKKARVSALRRRLRANSLYAEFERTGTVSPDPYGFTDLLECSPDASNAVVARRFDELRGQVLLVDEPELLKFLDECKSAHADMLERD
jgi:hypothetical protein